MKNMIFILTCGLLGIAGAIGLLLFSTKISYKTQLADTLPTAMKNVKLTDFDNREDYGNALKECFENQANLNIEVKNFDSKKGLVTVSAKENYTDSLGNSKTVTEERTLILDATTGQENESYTVTFFENQEDYVAGEKAYKTYVVKYGSKINAPKLPEGYVAWWGAEEHAADFAEAITENRCYYAVAD